MDSNRRSDSEFNIFAGTVAPLLFKIPPLIDPPRPKPGAPLMGNMAGLCSRVSKAGGGNTQGLCLLVNGSHFQAIDVPSIVIAEGTYAWEPETELSISVLGSNVSFSINGYNFSGITSKQRGMFGLMSGWNEAYFDDFSFSSM